MNDKRFEPLPWQRPQWNQLNERLAVDRLPHALLFSGPRGVGKRRFAERFARALLCERPTSDGACGGCRACTLFDAGSHPDFLVLQPEEAGKEIGVGPVRALIESLTLKSQYGRFKVVLLEPAERMTISAANALLKTLEEPTPNTLLLLLSSQPAALLPTIRSRCQQIAFGPPPADEARAWLARELPAGGDPALLLSLAAGAPLAALEWAGEEALKERATLAEELIALVLGRAEPVAVASRWAEHATARVLGLLDGLVGDLIRLKLLGANAHPLNRDLTGSLKAAAEAVDLERLFEQLDGLSAARRLTQRQANIQLLLEDWCIGWNSR